MRAASEKLSTEPTKNGGQITAGTDKSVHPVTNINAARITFRDLAKFAWPEKTDQFLSHLTGYDARTCRRWMAGSNEPPAEALGVIIAEIMRRFHVR